MKTRTRWLVTAGMVCSLLVSAAASAEETIVPVSELKPAAPMSKPSLTPTGGALILSDSPESPTTEGAYYRDRVTGQFRVFWHHANMTGAPLNIAVAVTNTSNEPVMLFTEGQGVGVDYYPDLAGQDALAAYMNTHGSKKMTALLQPGETYELSARTPDTYTVSGIVQLHAQSQRGNEDATVTVTTLGFVTPPEHPEQVPILPGDVHVRGTFPHFDRTGTLTYNTTAGNSLIRISSAPSGKWSDSMPGEYEYGINAIDGSTVVNSGNYGVMYNLAVEINNESDNKKLISVYDNPSGGAGHYVIGWAGSILQSSFLDYTRAWKFTEFKVNKKGKTVQANLSLTGGAAGPQVLYFTNSDL
ncbi:hypothetical protein [Paenibacillus beijingensis]|uniref:Copper amine oxidase-like N-terminal domain-containing protein n=1 Tax=Paenibacillus beijingensis TaxID=1126833 RepID=A0A0D5NFM7_9BACL|nr:hypothetical protein [Paenibacillus beijingensis]AJY74071.1 hypothetical protein VN24_04965 [Paenibacillus beijingensis]